MKKTKAAEVQLTNAQGKYKQAELKKLKGGFFLILGYLLSPLCWWNDLLFNFPIAYFFGYICSWFDQDAFLPATILGYWFSNLVGILLMQLGAVEVFQEQGKERNWKKELFTGLASSTVYTLVVLVLIQFKILNAPALFSNS